MTTSPTFGPKSRPILTLYTPDPDNPGGQVQRAWMGELTECTIEPGAGNTSLTSIHDGADAPPWYLKGAAVQSADAASLWRFTWDYSGEVVPYTFAPLGNDTPTAYAPILSGSLVVGPRPELGGAASDKTFTFEFDWRLTDEPILDDGSGS